MHENLQELALCFEQITKELIGKDVLVAEPWQNKIPTERHTQS